MESIHIKCILNTIVFNLATYEWLSTITSHFSVLYSFGSCSWTSTKKKKCSRIEKKTSDKCIFFLPNLNNLFIQMTDFQCLIFLWLEHNFQVVCVPRHFRVYFYLYIDVLPRSLPKYNRRIPNFNSKLAKSENSTRFLWIMM